MTKYIKTKDGKFAGSIGDGKTKTPRTNTPPRVPIAKHLDPSDGRGQIIAMAAGWQQLRVQEEVHKGFENIDNYLVGTLSEDELKKKIDRLSKMHDRLSEERQYRQADIAAALAHYSEVAIWAKTNNDKEIATEAEPVVVDIDLAGMYHDVLFMSQNAAWDDLSAVDDSGEPIAARSIEAYTAYGSP